MSWNDEGILSTETTEGNKLQGLSQVKQFLMHETHETHANCWTPAVKYGLNVEATEIVGLLPLVNLLTEVRGQPESIFYSELFCQIKKRQEAALSDVDSLVGGR